MTPFPVVFRQEYLLLVELSHESWRVVDWQQIQRSGDPRAEFLAMRARQLERRPDDTQHTAKAQKKSRESNQEYFDKLLWQSPRNHEIRNGDHVLLHDTKVEASLSHKLSDRWTGNYKVTNVIRKGNRGTCRLAKLDGTKLDGFYTGDRPKRSTEREKSV
jgi:hypothetical protein